MSQNEALYKSLIDFGFKNSKDNVSRYEYKNQEFICTIVMNDSKTVFAEYKVAPLFHLQEKHYPSLDELLFDLRLLINNNSDPETCIAKADLLYTLGFVEKAITYYDQVLIQDPFNAQIYVARGIARDHLDDYKAAIEDYSKALEINPDCADAYFARGLIHSELSDSTAAIQDYSKLIELEPQNEEAYYARALIKGLSEDFKGAIIDYSAAINIDPDFADAYYQRGMTKDHLRDEVGALLDIQMAKNIFFESNDMIGYEKAKSFIDLIQSS